VGRGRARSSGGTLFRVAPSLALPVLAASLVSACEAGDPRGTLELEPWDVRVDLRIGSVDDPETALTSVSTLLPGAGGRIYVAQPTENVIRIHGPDGEPLGRIGRPGSGPGEFGLLTAMGWWDPERDTLWVSDVAQNRLSLFTADGEFVRSLLLQVPPYRDVMAVRAVRAVLPDGTGLAQGAVSAALLESGTVSRIPILRFPLEGGPAEPVVETPVGNLQLAIRMDEGMNFSVQPFVDSPLVAVAHPPGRIVVVGREAAIAAEDARFTVTAFSADGDTLWSREYGYQPSPILRAEVDSVVESRVEMIRSFAQGAGVGPRELESRIRDQLHAPPFRPPVQQVLISPEGDIWLRIAAAPGSELSPWWKLDPGGSPVARMELPSNMTLRAVERDAAGGGVGWAVETDELDVPYVVRLRMGPESSSGS
jgi:hypothetical protein